MKKKLGIKKTLTMDEYIGLSKLIDAATDEDMVIMQLDDFTDILFNNDNYTAYDIVNGIKIIRNRINKTAQEIVDMNFLTTEQYIAVDTLFRKMKLPTLDKGVLTYE